MRVDASFEFIISISTKYKMMGFSLYSFLGVACKFFRLICMLHEFKKPHSDYIVDFSNVRHLWCGYTTFILAHNR